MYSFVPVVLLVLPTPYHKQLGHQSENFFTPTFLNSKSGESLVAGRCKVCAPLKIQAFNLLKSQFSVPVSALCAQLSVKMLPYNLYLFKIMYYLMHQKCYFLTLGNKVLFHVFFLFSSISLSMHSDQFLNKQLKIGLFLITK